MLSDYHCDNHRRLSEDADMTYLLRDVDEVYRRSSAGGSKVIRSHQRRVRESVSRVLECDGYLLNPVPVGKPVVDHLPRALELGASGPLAQLARTVGRVATRLVWAHGYDKMPRSLARRYAFTEILGPSGPIFSENVIIGLVLFAPGTVYPQHSHQQIEESYVSVAGAWSENDAAVYAQGSLILNRPGDLHRITVGDRDPCLLVYAWLGTLERLRQPEMVFTRGRRGEASIP